MSNEMELAQITQRLNELRAVPMGGGKLSREELREGIELLAKAQAIRASRVSKAKGADLAAESKKSISDLGF